MKFSLPVVLALATATGMASAHRNIVGRGIFPLGREASANLVKETVGSSIFSVANKLFLHELGQAQANNNAPINYAVTHDHELGVITLRMELPGVSSDDLKVVLEDDALLRITGTYKALATDHITTIDEAFQLIDGVDPNSIKVKLRNGILEVSAEKKPKVVKRLSIQVSHGGDGTAELEVRPDGAIEKSSLGGHQSKQVKMVEGNESKQMKMVEGQDVKQDKSEEENEKDPGKVDTQKSSEENLGPY